jgi:hypothetical protein
VTEPTDPGGIDFSALNANDAPPITDPVKPNHKASQDRPRGSARRRATENSEAKDKPTSTRTKKAANPLPPKRKGQFVEPLENMYGTMGLMLMPFRPMTAQATMENAHNCAVAVDEWAYQNDAVRRIIHKLVTASAAGAVITAHLPILMALAMESGVFNREPQPEPTVINPDGSPVNAAA